MKEIISNKFDQRWKNIVMDGTKPPVKPSLRKQLNHLIKNQPNHAATTTTTTNSDTPLVMVIYFAEGAIPIDRPQPRVKKDNNDESLSNQITNMKLINDSSPSTTNPVVIDNSPVKDDQLANVLSPLTNYPIIIDDNLPSTDDYQIKDNSLVSDDDKLINDESIEDYDPEDNYLKNLKEENEIIMKQFDDRIEKFQTKIKKVSQELQQMNRNLKELIVQKEQKYNEFIQILNEHKRKLKNKKQNQNRQKTVKRMKQTTINGRK